MESRKEPTIDLITLLPCKQVLLEFLQYYKTLRQPERESWMSSVGRAVGVTGDSLLDQMVNDVTTQIETAVTWNDWYNLIFILRENAEIAQEQKTTLSKWVPLLYGTESYLRMTFHAMACFIISELHNCRYKEGSAEALIYNTPLQMVMNDMRDEYDKVIVKIKEDALSSGTNSDTLAKREKELTRSLAFLGDTFHAALAFNHNALGNMQKGTPVFENPKKPELAKTINKECNPSGPRYLQPAVFAKGVYITLYQNTAQISFEQFVRDSKENEETKLQEHLNALIKEQAERKQSVLKDEEQHERMKELNFKIQAMSSQLCLMRQLTGKDEKKVDDNTDPDSGAPRNIDPKEALADNANPADTAPGTAEGNTNIIALQQQGLFSGSASASSTASLSSTSPETKNPGKY